MTDKKNVEMLIGFLASKILESNAIGRDEMGVLADGMKDYPVASFEVFFHEAKLTVFTGETTTDGFPVTETITTGYYNPVTEEKVCEMIDRVNEVATERRERFKNALQAKYEKAKAEYEELLKS